MRSRSGNGFRTLRPTVSRQRGRVSGERGTTYVDVVPDDILGRDLDELLGHHERLGGIGVSVSSGREGAEEAYLVVADALREDVCAHLEVALDERAAQRLGHLLRCREHAPLLLDALIESRNLGLQSQVNRCTEAFYIQKDEPCTSQSCRPSFQPSS